MERQPIEMLGRRVRELLAPSKERVASFVGADPDGLGFVTNATEGVNAALRSVSWRPGDRVVATDHVYHAVRQTLRRLATEADVEYVEIPLPLPLKGPDDVIDAIGPFLESPTRLLVVDHITSPTAVRIPVEPLIARCLDAGIESLVDGAHAPGMLDLDLETLGADHYTGNFHKWSGAPLGTAFLWSSRGVRHRVHPNVTSHFYGEGFAREFDWQGTRDFSPWIVAAEAIADLGRLDWRQVRTHNQTLCAWAHAMLVDLWGVEPMTPLDGSMLGSIASIELPAKVAVRHERAEALQAELLEAHGIEIPVIDWGGRRFVRISAMVYNRPWQYERLGDAVAGLAV